MSVNSKKMKSVARSFIHQYYLKLFESPVAPLALYSEESNFFHAHNLESGEFVTGTQRIAECLIKLAYKGGSVDLHCGSFDIQPSANEGYLLMVTGLIKCRADSEPRQFIHTFFLAKNPKGNSNSLFVLNDCLRFIGHSNAYDGHQTKSPEFVAEEMKQNDQISTKDNTPIQKKEHLETVEVPQQPEIVVLEKEHQVIQSSTDNLTNTGNNFTTNQLDDGWGANVEDEDENDSDYVDEEEQDDVDEDDDDELFDDENEQENDIGSGIDFIEPDEVPPRRTEGKWVPKKKSEEPIQNKVTPTVTQQPINLIETKKVEPTQTQSSHAHQHQHHHAHKQVEPVTQTEQSEPETQKSSKIMSYANVAGKNTSQPSNPVPTILPKKKHISTPPPVSAPVNTNVKTAPQSQPNLANLYVGNLNSEVTEEQLRETFGSFGPIKKVTMKNTIAFIEFNSNNVVPEIVEQGKKEQFQIGGQSVKVDLTRPPTSPTKNQNGGSRGGRGGGQFNNVPSNNRQNKKTKK